MSVVVRPHTWQPVCISSFFFLNCKVSTWASTLSARLVLPVRRVRYGHVSFVCLFPVVLSAENVVVARLIWILFKFELKRKNFENFHRVESHRWDLSPLNGRDVIMQMSGGRRFVLSAVCLFLTFCWRKVSQVWHKLTSFAYLNFFQIKFFKNF